VQVISNDKNGEQINVERLISTREQFTGFIMRGVILKEYWIPCSGGFSKMFWGGSRKII